MVALRQGDNLTLADVPAELTTTDATTAPTRNSVDPSDLPISPLQVAEREAIVRLLEQHYWNISDAARHSRVSRNTLYRKMKQYRIRSSRRVE